MAEPYSPFSLAIDLSGVITISFVAKKERRYPNASLLHEVLYQKGNEKRQEDNHEKWQTGDPGLLPGMRKQDIPNREQLRLYH